MPGAGLTLTALPRLAPLEDRRARRRGGLGRVLCPHLGLVVQHRADFRPLCLEVRVLIRPYSTLC